MPLVRGAKYGIRRSALLAAAVCVVLADGASAQGRRLAAEDSLVPVALLRSVTDMLLPGGEPGSTNVLLGRLPAGLEGRLPAIPGARTIAMISTPVLDVILLESDEPADSLAALITRQLPVRGWRLARGGAGGFVEPGSSRETWCGSSSSLRFSVDRARVGASHIRYWLMQPEMTACAPRRTNVRGAMATLFHPEGAGSWVSCARALARSSSGTSEWVETPLRVPELMEHYAEQLADSGWGAAPTSGDGAVASRQWRRTGSDGVSRTLRLTVRSPDGDSNCRLVEMTVDEETRR
jgi:hypothetical protein